MPTADSPAPPQDRVVVTGRARRAIVRTCRDVGRQAVYLSWPAGATFLPATAWRPGDFDVIVGHIARCPIYADIRQLGLFAHRRAVIDVLDTRLPRRRPVLRVRTADASAGAPAGLPGPSLVA